MNIGLDIDGVVYPWHESIYRYFREYRGFTGSAREFWTYFMGLPHDVQEYYVSIPTLYLDSVPTPDVMTYVPKLAEVATIYYITSRSSALWWATKKFFSIYDLPFSENVIFTKDKVNYVRELKIKYFLDDLPRNVDALLPVTDVYLFKAAHNWEHRDAYKTLNTMKEYYELVQS